MKNIRWRILVVAWLAIGAAVPASGAKRFLITNFGAVGDGKTSNTTALQALIDKVAKEGGGAVVVPSGTFLTGALFFKQGVNLFIEKNGALKGSVEQNDYPQVKTRWEGIEREWTSALLNFTDMNGVDVGGDVTVDGIDIRADHNIPSSDGIDIDSSRKVRVRNVDIDVNDDCITIKSGKDEDGLRVNRPSEDIIIENSRFHYGHGGVAMGSETSGGIRNVTTRHCVADSDNWAPIRFKTQPSRGFVMENARQVDLSGLKITVKNGDAITKKNVE
jgi:polygalacturonase